VLIHVSASLRENSKSSPNGVRVATIIIYLMLSIVNATPGSLGHQDEGGTS
jgi:hypothetical protein